jgi:hypothetical protein
MTEPCDKLTTQGFKAHTLLAEGAVPLALHVGELTGLAFLPNERHSEHVSRDKPLQIAGISGSSPTLQPVAPTRFGLLPVRSEIEP